MSLDDPGAGLSVPAVAERLDRVRERLASAGAEEVTLVAVTKGFDHRAVEAALAVGLHDLGENYAQELLTKAPAATGSDARWHFIGRLQRNKVRRLAPFVSLWQSVDRLDLGAEIARRAPGAAVLVQVDINDEPQKGGVPIDEVEPTVDALLALGLDVQGLMGVAPSGGAEVARGPFERLVARAETLGLPIRSIGMSEDLEVAVAAGATMVRIGSALFGPPSAADLRALGEPLRCGGPCHLRMLKPQGATK